MFALNRYTTHHLARWSLRTRKWWDLFPKVLFFSKKLEFTSSLFFSQSYLPRFCKLIFVNFQLKFSANIFWMITTQNESTVKHYFVNNFNEFSCSFCENLSSIEENIRTETTSGHGAMCLSP